MAACAGPSQVGDFQFPECGRHAEQRPIRCRRRLARTIALDALNFDFDSGYGRGRRSSFLGHERPFGCAADAATAESPCRLSPWAKTGSNRCSGALRSPWKSSRKSTLQGDFGGEKPRLGALCIGCRPNRQQFWDGHGNPRHSARYGVKLREAQADLAHVLAMLRLFEASGEPADFPAYIDLNRVFRRRETTTLCIAALEAEGQLDSQCDSGLPVFEGGI